MKHTILIIFIAILTSCSATKKPNLLTHKAVISSKIDYFSESLGPNDRFLENLPKADAHVTGLISNYCLKDGDELGAAIRDVRKYKESYIVCICSFSAGIPIEDRLVTMHNGSPVAQYKIVTINKSKDGKLYELILSDNIERLTPNTTFIR